MEDIIVRETKLIEVSKIHPNEWNPNEQSDEIFNQLVEEIREDGFDHPLNVVPCEWEGEEGHYVIIGGEHRWQASKLLGLEKVPCFIHDDWDEAQQKLKTVRRNLLGGSLNARKFTDLVNSLKHTLDVEDMPTLFGFEDSREFEKYLIDDREEKDRSFLDSLVEDSKRELHATDSLMAIVATIFKECDGLATIDQNYLFFTLKGSLQMALICDHDTWKTVEEMVAHIRESGEKATDFVGNALKNALKSVD